MKCPSCDETLMISERSGVEIDFCPKCRGVWLDRGELDKIISRVADDDRDDDDDDRRRPVRDYERRVDPRDAEPVPYGDGGYRRKRRKSILGELFDF